MHPSSSEPFLNTPPYHPLFPGDNRSTAEAISRQLGLLAPGSGNNHSSRLLSALSRGAMSGGTSEQGGGSKGADGAAVDTVMEIDRAESGLLSFDEGVSYTGGEQKGEGGRWGQGAVVRSGTGLIRAGRQMELRASRDGNESGSVCQRCCRAGAVMLISFERIRMMQVGAACGTNWTRIEAAGKTRTAIL